MSKTNYTKVEEMLDQGMQKIKVAHLLEEADAAGGSHAKQAQAKISQEKSDQKEAPPSHLISSIRRDLKILQKKDREAYVKLGIKKNYLKKIIETPEALTPEELETLKQIQEKIKVFKEELKKTLPPINDEVIIEAQRTKHINKRYNVNDKWLPLQ